MVGFPYPSNRYPMITNDEVIAVSIAMTATENTFTLEISNKYWTSFRRLGDFVKNTFRAILPDLSPQEIQHIDSSYHREDGTIMKPNFKLESVEQTSPKKVHVACLRRDCFKAFENVGNLEDITEVLVPAKFREKVYKKFTTFGGAIKKLDMSKSIPVNTADFTFNVEYYGSAHVSSLLEQIRNSSENFIRKEITFPHGITVTFKIFAYKKSQARVRHENDTVEDMVRSIYLPQFDQQPEAFRDEVRKFLRRSIRANSNTKKSDDAHLNYLIKKMGQISDRLELDETSEGVMRQLRNNEI